MIHRRLLALVVALHGGCGGSCPEIAAERRVLDERTTAAPGPHAQVQIPLARANAFIAELLHDQALEVPLTLPTLGPFALPARELTAIAREVRVRPAPPGRLRFAIRLEIDDARQPLTTLDLETEVVPELVRDASGAELVAGFGPGNLLAVRPELGGDAQRVLGAAIARWLPAAVRDRVPAVVLDRAAGALGEHLTGAGYRLLQATLLRRLGELTRLRLRLPELPIAQVAVSSSEQPAERLIVDLTTELPVRRALPAAGPPGDEITVRIAGSTAAELTNWAIEHRQLPQRYTRDLEPAADGEYRPRFDYLAEEPVRPIKIHVFQERGGCSYFRAGLRPELRIVDDKLEVTTLDQLVELAHASRVLEAALWLKQLIFGSVDHARRAASHTRLTIGGRTFTARVVQAAVNNDALEFELRLASEHPPVRLEPVVR